MTVYLESSYGDCPRLSVSEAPTGIARDYREAVIFIFGCGARVLFQGAEYGLKMSPDFKLLSAYLSITLSSALSSALSTLDLNQSNCPQSNTIPSRFYLSLP